MKHLIELSGLSYLFTIKVTADYSWFVTATRCTHILIVQTFTSLSEEWVFTLITQSTLSIVSEI